MVSRISPRIVVIAAVFAAPAGAALPMHAASSAERPGIERPGAADARAAAEAQRLQRQMQSIRQSQDEAARARATEQRRLDIQRRVYEIKPPR